MSHKNSDRDSANASDLLMSQTGNSQGYSSASDLLMSQGAVDSKDIQCSFDIVEKKVIENLEELLNGNTVNLDETILYNIDDRTDDAGSSLYVVHGQSRARRRPAYLDDFVG